MIGSLLERLRVPCATADSKEAADAMERLTAENERLRAALTGASIDFLLLKEAALSEGKTGLAQTVSGFMEKLGFISSRSGRRYDQQPITTVEMRQPEEHRKNAEARARLGALSGCQQQPPLCDKAPNKHHYLMPSGQCSCQDQSWAK